MTTYKRSLLLRQEIELLLDDAGGSPHVKMPGKPTTVRAVPSAAAAYIDQVVVADDTTGIQVDGGLTLDGAWLMIEHLGDDTDNNGEIGIWDADPAGAGNELGICDAGQRFGPIRIGADLAEIWVRGDLGLGRDCNVRVLIIEA